MKNYIAITIGPIFSTLQQARKTREIWAASYLYSQLMEFLLIEITAIGAEIILPQKISDSGRNRYGAGVYNDRLFAAIRVEQLTKIDDAINAAVKKLSEVITPAGKSEDPDFWHKFLRIEWVNKSLNTLENGDLFKKIEPLLNTAELHTPYFMDVPVKDRLIELLNDVYDTPMAKSALKGDARGQYGSMMKGLFPSTADLATFELFQKRPGAYKNLQERINLNDRQDEEQLDLFFEKLYENDSEFKDIATDYHKYYCIVHADGDNLSALNSTLKNEEAYKVLSGKLGSFALKAAKLINLYGGKPVFIGGDDLLFFAPVCSIKEGKTVSVLQLVSALDREYNALGLSGTTLSFGITLSYYKYPLFEAMQLSYEQMSYYAKKVKWNTEGEKNAIAFRLLKHSGAYFEGLISKPVLAAFIRAEEEIRVGEKDLISGVVYKMETLSSLFANLLAQGQLDDRIPHLFDNFFNEPIHKRNKTQIVLVQLLLIAIYKSTYHIEGMKIEHTKNLYAILRLLKFVSDKPAGKPAQALQNAQATFSNS